MISDFSFSKSGGLTKANEPSVPYYLPIPEEGGGNNDLPKEISTS